MALSNRLRFSKPRLEAPIFLRETANEMKHVTWPRSAKVGIFTVMVIICTIIVAYFISFIDLGFLAGLREARLWLNPNAATESAAPSVTATQPQILDSNGNPIQIESITTNPGDEPAAPSPASNDN